MHFALDTPNFGDSCEPCLLAELVRAAEAAGWDGFFLLDRIGAGVNWPFPIGDPWIVLAAMSITTERIKSGPLVTPLLRRAAAWDGVVSMAEDHMLTPDEIRSTSPLYRNTERVPNRLMWHLVPRVLKEIS